MNNIFKVIWNHATQAWTAVGELASAKSKSKSIKLAAISTALLAVAGVAQAEKEVVQKASNSGGLTISVVDKSKDGTAVANSVDGIAIGNNAHANQETGSVGNGHIAIGLNALATGNGSPSSSVALGANSKATGQGSTAIGNASSSTGGDAVALGNSSVADSNGAVAVGTKSSAWFHGSALGEEAKARGIRSTALGNRAEATSDSAISIGFKTKVGSQFAIGIGRETSVTGKESVAVGNKSTISSANVSTLGANITVAAGRDGGVVLGHSSDAAISTTKVEAVNNATVGGLTYSGFAGKLDKPTTALQGHFVSIGKQGDERQIKHVAAGKISNDSTDAINGSQLYSVADTITTAIKNVLGGAASLSNESSKSTFSSPVNTTPLTEDYKAPTDTPKTVAGALQDLNNYVNAGWKVGNNAGNKVSRITPNGQVNFVNGNGTTAIVTQNGTNGANVTFNVKKDTIDNNVLNVSENGVSVVSGTITAATKNTNGEVKADDAKDNQVATVKNVVEAINSAGFVVSNGKSDKSELINAGKTLTLTGGDGVNVEQEGSNFTFSIDSSKLLEGKTGNITVNKDKKAGEADAGKAIVNNDDATKLATVKNVAEAINGAKWFAKVENLSDSMNVRTQNDNDADAQAMGAGDILTLKADKNLAVKRVGANVTYGLASEIEVDKITVKSKTPGEATTTFENGKVTNLKDHLKTPEKVAADKAAVPNAEEVKTPELTADKKKEAATVNDVLNAGWNLKTNGNQAAAITNGKGLDFASDDNSVTITPTVDKDGNAKVNFSVNATSVINNNKGSIKEAATDPKAANAGKVTVSDADKDKLATVDTVAEAINSAATFVKVADSQEVITTSTANDNGVAVKSGDTVTHTAGKNLKVKRDGKSVTYALAQDIDVNSVKATNGVTIGGGDNTTTITSNDKGLNLAGKDGAATNINNVKDAELSSESKQAVNGSQLHATNVQVNNNAQNINRVEGKVNNLSQVINNHAGELNRLDRKVNKYGKEARAGIAGANAAAALPQVYTPGKSMVAASAGTFKGQNAVAVGYSRASDNGKVILKLQGNANTSGDVGAGVGVGYQW